MTSGRPLVRWGVVRISLWLWCPICQLSYHLSHIGSRVSRKSPYRPSMMARARGSIITMMIKFSRRLLQLAYFLVPNSTWRFGKLKCAFIFSCSVVPRFWNYLNAWIWNMNYFSSWRKKVCYLLAVPLYVVALFSFPVIPESNHKNRAKEIIYITGTRTYRPQILFFQ